MTDLLKTIGGDIRTRRERLRGRFPKPAVDVGKPSDAENDADEVYPAEFLPVGDPRPGSE
jgi:hypothetical protein